MRAALAAVIAFIFGLNGLIAHWHPERFPEELPRAFEATRGFVGGTRDLVLVGFGLRRLAADLAMLDLLIYYGSPDETAGDWDHASGFGRDTNMYRDLLPMTKRMIGLDPFFRHGVLYGAGALAFNEGRFQQAVEILKSALKRDPDYWPYSLNLSAIAYKKTRDFPEIIRFLETVYPLPECPTMLKNILANTYIKTGQINKAAAIFEWMASDAPEADYRELARSRLEMMRRR
ncbi:MAG: hypothetical protein HYT79_09035 [Elusimicrobia bacterium]|nr:hypothetical protein [Elusimicrobiota bacterium]